MLDSLNVVQPDTAESLSIPLQQIGRYIKMVERYLTVRERTIIHRIAMGRFIMSV